MFTNVKWGEWRIVYGDFIGFAKFLFFMRAKFSNFFVWRVFKKSSNLSLDMRKDGTTQQKCYLDLKFT